MFPTLDCNLSLNKCGTHKEIIKANDWITMDPESFLTRIYGAASFKKFKTAFTKEYKMILDNITLIYDSEDRIIGRGALCRRLVQDYDYENEIAGVVTVGGARTCKLIGVAGVLTGGSQRATRDSVFLIANESELRMFVKSQLYKIKQCILSDDIQIEYAEISRALCKYTGFAKIAQYNKGYLNYEELVEVVRQQEYDEYILVSNDAIKYYEETQKQRINLSDNVFCSSNGRPPTVLSEYTNVFLGECNYQFNNYTLQGRVIEAIEQAWGCKADELSLASDEYENITAVVGTCNGKNVEIDNSEYNQIEIITKKK